MSVRAPEEGVDALARSFKLPREERARRRREMLLKALREALASQSGKSEVVDKELGEGVEVHTFADEAEAKVHYYVYCGGGGRGVDKFKSVSMVLKEAPGGKFHTTSVEVVLDPRTLSDRPCERGRYSVEELGLVAARAAETFNDVMAALGAPLRVSGSERSGDVIHAVLKTPLGRYRGSAFTADMVSGVPAVWYRAVVKVDERLTRRLRFLKRYTELVWQEEERWLEALSQRLSAALGKEVRCKEDYETYLTKGWFVVLALYAGECFLSKREVDRYPLLSVEFKGGMDLSKLENGVVVTKWVSQLTEEELVRVLDEESRRVVEVLVRAVALMKQHPDPVQREHAHFLWTLIEKAYYDVTGESLTTGSSAL